MAPTIRLLVADDHTLLRTALCNTLRLDPRITIVAEAGNGEEAVRAAVVHRPDIVLLDVEMPGQHVALTVRQLNQIAPHPAVMILSMYDDRCLEQDLARLGVRAYLHKSVTVETLTSAIELVAGSKQQLTISVSAHVQGAAPALAGGGQPSPSVSTRELEVLHCVAEAMSNRQIATSLGITEGTVKRHLRNIFTKLDAVSRLDAVNKAVSQALIGPSSVHRPRNPHHLTPVGVPSPTRSRNVRENRLAVMDREPRLPAYRAR